MNKTNIDTGLTDTAPAGLSPNSEHTKGSPQIVSGDGGIKATLHRHLNFSNLNTPARYMVVAGVLVLFGLTMFNYRAHVGDKSPLAYVAAHLGISREKPTGPSQGEQAVATKTMQQAIADRPNVIFITLDDADLSLMQYLPKTKALIADQGATFTHYYDSLALCCSARATYLRGQYVHNNGIWSNSWPDGGFGKFHDLGEEDSTIATWMHDAQYQTSLMGKYLNEYPTIDEDPTKSVPKTYVPAGWTNWAVPVAGRAYNEFGYKLNINGVVDNNFRTDKDPANYLVDTTSRMADQYITDQAQAGNNYFLYVAPYAPHKPFTPAPRYKDDFPGLHYTQNPSFNEADVSDKPDYISGSSPLTTDYIKTINRDYRDRVRDMEGIDDLVENLYNTLQATGQLDNTYLIFTSDNGFHMGEHRLPEGKLTPYEEDLHLPLWIRGPGITPGTTIDNIVSDVDMAPTFAELTGATIPSFVDGHSLVPLLAGQQPTWRKYLLIERSLVDDGGGNSPTGKYQATDVNEPSDNLPVGPNGKTISQLYPAYYGLHSGRFVYVDYYDSGGVNKEFYDLQSDPYELQNLLGPGSPGLTQEQQDALTEMQAVLADQKACSYTTTPCL
jgi:arylsulfatase A-like enzyme